LFPFPTMRRIFHLASGSEKHRTPAKTVREGSRMDNPEPDEILALPYLQGSRLPTNGGGVVKYVRGAAADGINLLFSTHAPEAYLFDMEGKILHRWQDQARTLDQQGHPRRDDYWRRGYLFPNGDLLAIHPSGVLEKLDKDSHLLWRIEIGAHHD